MMDIEPLITTIAEHKVDLNLLPKKATVLDLGCLNFIFTNEMRRLGHSVTPVDIQELTGHSYYRIAITDYNGYGYVVDNKDKQAVRFSKIAVDESKKIKCYTLETFMRELNLEYFDYIKCDVESSELEIIMSLSRPPSRQFECEFHLHTGIYDDEAVDIMVNHLKNLGYGVVSHEKTSQHGLPPNYWSSLFILK